MADRGARAAGRADAAHRRSNTAADDSQSLQRIASLLQGLQELGWTVGRNVQIETRWGVGDPRAFAGGIGRARVACAAAKREDAVNVVQLSDLTPSRKRR